jgi:superfamily II DNA or RNA helicase
MLNKQKDKVQQEALSAWELADKKGTCEIITGLGKTFIGLHALYTMPKDDNVIHLFLAEVKDRRLDLARDIDKYNKIFNRNVLADYNLEFHCYQTAYKWKNRSFGLVIADEIHDALSPAYSLFFMNNKFESIIGLSATVTTGTAYKHSNGDTYTKGDLLKQIAPICYTYGLNLGIQEGTSRKLDVYIIKHKLDDKNKTVQAGSKRKRFYQTEKQAYDYWDKEHKKAWFITDEETRNLKIRITSHKRSTILYNLESKVNATKALIEKLHSRTILFGNSLDALLKVTPNVVSSRNTDAVNDMIRYKFEAHKTDLIGSFKKLKQGANLPNIDNCIIMSYYSTDKDFIQRVGRLRQNNKIGNIFIFLTENTQEVTWFTKVFENISELNMIYCQDVDDCVSKLKSKP